MSLISSIEISNEPESSQITEIVQSFIKKLTNTNLSDKSTDEVIKSLSSSFESTLRAFESASDDIKQRLENETFKAKDEIDLRIESLKSELDELREELYKDVDNKQKQILNEHDPIKVNKMRQNFESLCEGIRLEGVSKKSDAIKFFARNVERKAEHALNLKLRISLKIPRETKLKESIGYIKAISNIDMPGSTWSFNMERCDVTKYVLLNKIRTGNDEINSIKSMGNELLAVRFNSHINIYNYNTGESMQTLNCDKFSKEFFMCALRGRKLLTINKFKVSIWKWDTLETCTNSSINDGCEIYFACELSDGTVACAQRYRKCDQNNIILCVLDNLKLVKRGCIESAHKSQMNCILALPKNFFASSAVRDCEIKIWSGKDASLIRILKHEHSVNLMTFTPDKRIISLTEGNSNYTWYYENTDDLCFNKREFEHDLRVKSLHGLSNGQFAFLFFDRKNEDAGPSVQVYDDHSLGFGEKLNLNGNFFFTLKDINLLEHLEDGIFAAHSRFQIAIFDCEQRDNFENLYHFYSNFAYEINNYENFVANDDEDENQND